MNSDLNFAFNHAFGLKIYLSITSQVMYQKNTFHDVVYFNFIRYNCRERVNST